MNNLIEEIIKDELERFEHVLWNYLDRHFIGIEEINNSDREVYMNREQLAAYLKIKKSHTYCMTEKNKIPCYAVGRNVIYKKHEVDEYIESCRKRK